jgi:hypothetical protein
MHNMSERETEKIVEQHLADEALVKRFKQQLNDLNAALSEMCERGIIPRLEIITANVTKFGRPIGRTFCSVRANLSKNIPM